jgi:hypothetical protein
MIDRDVTTRANLLADRYAHHCHAVFLSSNSRDYIDHPTYRELVNLGIPAVPIVIARMKLQDAETKEYESKGEPFRKSDNFFASWEWILDGITGLNYARPEPGRPYDIKAARQRYYQWWERQQRR